MQDLKTENLNVIDDGRYDPLDHNTGHGSYTIMNAEKNEIIDFLWDIFQTQRLLIHWSCTKVFNYLLESGLEILCLTSDHHKSIFKNLKKHFPNIIHQFNVWNFPKKKKKSFYKEEKIKVNNQLVGWTKSIINHFWWNSKTCQENPVIICKKSLVIEKVTNFTILINIIRSSLKRKVHRKRLLESSPAYNKLKHVVTDENMFNDLTYLTKFCHSGDLNLFHSLYNLNCPKELYFFAMVCMYALS